MGNEPWTSPVRGSWIREDAPLNGDVDFGDQTQIVLRRGLGSNVHKATSLLRTDLLKFGMKVVDVRDHFRVGPKRILIQVDSNPDEPESYRICTDRQGIIVTGADDRGAAFGVYELCERLGVDPLYIWTGFAPERHQRLIVKQTDYSQRTPTVRWRGLFHDDEDVLPRPIRSDGTPDPNGVVPQIWYERYFETALRLKMNMVAPWVRTKRAFAIQKLASDWGLAYTSHHYDILLSDPYHFDKGLAQARGVQPVWDWISNREGILKFWRAGVVENRTIDAIFPIGLRGTNDYSYRFPENWTQDQKIDAYNEALEIQSQLIDEGIPPNKPRLKHFTMYTEMLPFYQTGRLEVPEGTIFVWPDENDGIMRGLPRPGSTGRHGVYYHLAYLGATSITKQVHQTVPLRRIGDEFAKILRAGATEYMLVNVSELREYVMGTRFLADICWNGRAGLDRANADRRFLDWWSREYFGTPLAAQAINAYFDSIPNAVDLSVGGQKAVGALVSLEKKFAGEDFAPAMPSTLPMLVGRAEASSILEAKLAFARSAIHGTAQRRFFFENVELPAAIDRLNSLAALELVRAMSEANRNRATARCRTALKHLEELSLLFRRAERAPFGGWYGPTWIGQRTQVVHEPLTRLKALLAKLG